MNRTGSMRLAALAAIVGGCTIPDRATDPATRRVVSSFSGEVNLAAGTIRISRDPASASATGFVEIPVVQDGTPGSGPADTVELVTESAQTVAGGCGATNGFEGAIRLRSFYAGTVLRNAYVEITSMTPTGREACNSDPSPSGLSNQYGLFAYGTIGRAGTGFDAALRSWRFMLPDQTAFTFRGHVVADLVTSDAVAPNTVASPPAGVYAAGNSVTLTCTDSESGCARTYYTTDGSTPTPASAMYTIPIPISSSCTLRWFSVDFWGNASPVQSADYVLDTVPPTVASVAPSAGKVGVATGSTVVVTFSEPVDPATVSSVTFSVSGPDGAVAGAVSADATHRIFTFTPVAALQAEALYSVTVTSGVRDIAGNALAPAYASTFYTVTASRNIEPVTSATLAQHSVAYDYLGNGLAAWSATTQAGTAIVVATYRGTPKAWTVRPVLATERDNMFGSPIRVVNDAADSFLVVWCTRSAVRAVRVQNGVPATIVDLTTSGASLVATDLAASATAANRFLVARSYLGSVRGWYWNGAAWSAEATAGSGASPLLSGTTVYYRGGDNVTVMASTLATASATWGTPVAIATTTLAQGSPTALAVAAGTSTLVAFTTNKGHVWAQTGIGTSFGSPVDVSGTGSEATTPLALAAGAWSGEYAVAWVSASGKAYGAFRNGGSWPASPPLLFSASAAGVSLAGYSSGFVAAFAVRDAGSSIASLWAVPSAGVANSRTWGSALLVEDGTATAAEPGVVATGTNANVSWTQADPAAHEVLVRPYTGSALGTIETASATMAVAGSPTDVRLAANAIGEVMAVWTQDDMGSQNVFAAIHRATGWSAPTLVASRAGRPDVASNGTGFLVVAVASSATDPSTLTLVAVPYTDGAFGATEVVASGTIGSTPIGVPHVASDGAGYAAVWQRGPNVEAAIRNAGAWLSTRALGSASITAISGRGGEYLFLWDDQGPTYSIDLVRASGSGASWTWGATAYLGSYVYGFGVAAGPDGFFVAYRNSGGIVTGWKVVGGVAGAAIPLGYGTNPCDGPRVALSGSRYLIAWNCSDALKSAETDGSGALASVSHTTGVSGVEKAALGFGMSGAGAGTFRLLYSAGPTGPGSQPSNVYGKDSAGGTWSTRTTIDSRTESTQATVAVLWDGGAYLAAWGQTTATSAIVDDLVAWWAF